MAACENCGRRTAGSKHPKCDKCIDLGRKAAERLPGDPVGSPRKASRRRPHRLRFAHEVELLRDEDNVCPRDGLKRSAAEWHFETCLECQAVDAAYWALDAGDPRYGAWVWILDEHGALAPKGGYVVERYEQTSLGVGFGGFVQWCRYHGWSTKDSEALRAYYAACSTAVRARSCELGSEVWDNPLGLASIATLP